MFRQNAIANRKLEEEAAAARGQTEEARLANQRRIQEEAEKLRFATETLGIRSAAPGAGRHLLPADGDVCGRLRTPASELQCLAAATRVHHRCGAAQRDEHGQRHPREISAGASDLSKRTEQQAASLEETAAALDEITVNVRNSSQRTEEARSVAVLANENAARSAQVVSQAVEAMRRIEDSSQQISNIIGVIDEIAFQTNLLALNAGLSSARGEAGKGFAVVAQEVRELPSVQPRRPRRSRL